MRGLLNKLASRSLTVAGKWPQQQLRSVSSLRSWFGSSSLIGVNGSFRRLPVVFSRFSTGSGERDNEMERNSMPQENTTQPTENVSAGDFLPRGIHSLGVAGEGDKAMERNSIPMDSFKGLMAKLRSHDNLRGPTANMASQYNSMGPMANMNYQDGYRGPFSNMNSQDNSRGPSPITNSLDNLTGPTTDAGGISVIRDSLRSSGSSPRNINNRRNSRPMDFVKGVLQHDPSLYNIERDAHFVLIQLKRNNTHINVMDAKGDTKFWTASGNRNIGGGGKVTRYAAEATAEYVGRRVREMGLKSVVMRVKGFTHFKKKRQAIMSFKEGYSSSRSDRNPIVYIEDVTRKPHNGCRLPKKRRI